MSSAVDDSGPDESGPDESEIATRDRTRRTLIAILTVAVLAVAVAGGFFWGSRNSDSPAASATPGVNSVDAGFARDMATHHQQAVTMAGYARDNSTDPSVVTIAFDIETAQSIELGRMTGWLDDWGVSRTSGTEMAWMGSAHMAMGPGGLMPGMATAAQLTKLQTLKGKALDVLFLQLMIRHHQGGVAMARYAVTHASEDYVRTLAGQMVASQSGEIIVMEQMLRKLGATPLTPPVI